MAKKKMMAKSGGAETEADLKKKLAVAHHVLAMGGHGDDVYGHGSVRRPGADTFWMKPHRIGLEEVKPEDLLLIDLDGRVVRGKGRRHSEVFIHSEIYRARRDVCAVVHTHPVPATVFASLGVPLRPVTHEGVHFVPPDVPRFDETTDLIISPERGKAIARTLGNRPALFLVAHGIVAVGGTIEEATINALLLNKAARDQLLVPGGQPRHWSSDEDALAKRERVHNLEAITDRWAYLLRTLAQWKR